MFRRPSTAIANPWNLLRGIDRRFVGCHRGGTFGRDSISNAGEDRTEDRDSEIAISAVTVLELAHGIVRADTPERRARRQRFLDDLLAGMPVHPVTVPIALRAGRIDGELQAAGTRVPLADLLIGVTALELGYSVMTSNPRHFALIPNLVVNPR